MWEITRYYSENRKQIFALVDEPIKQHKIFIERKWAIKVIMDCRTSVHKFRMRLGFT